MIGIGPMELVIVLFMLGPFILVHCLLAFGVYRDAQRTVDKGGETELVGPVAWAAITLIAGIFGAALYWFVHRSSFKRT